MRILVNRDISDSDATLSQITVFDDLGRVVYRCYGCEDEFRAVKVKGETRIPAGHYDIAVRKVGGFHNRYSNDRRVKDIHRGMLEIMDVPNFQYILIHIGNFERDTDGCILVGAVRDSERMCVYRSVEAYRALYTKVIGSAESGTLTIDIEDNDRG